MIYEDEAGLTEKPEDTRYIKKLHQKKTRSTGSAGKGTWSQLCHYWDCGLGESAGASSLMAPSGVWNVPARWRLQPGLILWFPPDPRRRLSTFLNLSWWKGHCYHYKICNNGTQGGDGDPSFQVHPLRHPVAILVHYVIFISIHLNMLLFMFILLLLLMDSSGTRVCSQRKTRTIMICGLKRGISGCFSWGITWRKGLLYIHFSSFYSHNVAKSFKW